MAWPFGRADAVRPSTCHALTDACRPVTPLPHSSADRLVCMRRPIGDSLETAATFTVSGTWGLEHRDNRRVRFDMAHDTTISRARFNQP